MIEQSRSKNESWAVGSVVRIGFLSGLTVVSARSERDGLPDIYELKAKNGKRYEFIPHNGLRALR